MFRSDKGNNNQLSFSDSRLFLSGKASKLFADAHQWHNVFYTYFHQKLDDKVFSVLYDSHTGCPNALVRLLVIMMQLKEGMGWTDEQLFNECYFNVQARAALGLFDLQATVPSPSTYYLFKQKLTSYEQENGINLISKVLKIKLLGSRFRHYLIGKLLFIVLLTLRQIYKK